MSKKWVTSLGGLSVGLCLAVITTLYKSPGATYYEMTQAMTKQPEWSLRAEGVIGGHPIKMDLATNAEKKSFVRISYAPLKIINNQWIDISGDPVSIAQIFHLTKRLWPAKRDGAWYDRYAFSAPSEVAVLFPGIDNIAGELWLSFRQVLPARGIITVHDQSNPPARLEFYLAYDNKLVDEKTPTRPLADVLVQLENIKSGQNDKPKALIPLSAGVQGEPSFSNDFDQDGLSDALELFYGLDPANPDTDNDTLLDGFDY